MAIYNVNKTTGDITETAGRYGDGTSTVIDWEDWNELTPQEQQTGKYTITNCPWADGNVSIDLMTKLWENPDTTHSFGEQDIDLSSGDYDLLLVIAKFHTTVNRDISIIVTKGSNAYLNCSGYPVNSAIFTMYRTIVYVSDTKLRAYPGNITGTEDNNRLIPYQIYGIKLTASVKINAIALDVSTSANKCMLSDGVTSVEDRLDSHVSVTNSGSETTSSMLNRLWALVDLSKVTPRSVLLFNGAVSTYIYTKTSEALSYNVSSYNATTKIKSILNFVVTSSNSVAVQTSTPASGTTSENNFASRTTDSGFTLYY